MAESDGIEHIVNNVAEVAEVAEGSSDLYGDVACGIHEVEVASVAVVAAANTFLS